MASFAAASFLSLKNPNTGREHTGTFSTTGATRTPEEYDRSTARERGFAAAWRVHGELELRSRPWNTILPEEFMRGESTERQRCGGGGEGRRRAGLRPARDEEDEEVEWRWEERTRRMRGGLGSAAESRERRGMSSWSWPEEDDDDEREKREEARERDASESELSRRSGAEASSDAEAPDERPLFRWSSSFSDLAAVEFIALPGVLAGADDGDGFGLCAAALFSPSNSRHRLEQLGALGEKTYGSAASTAAAAARSGFIGSEGAGIASGCGGRGAAASISGTAAALRSGSSFPSAKSSSAGSMVAEPPRLNSKSMKSLDIAGSGVVVVATAAAAARGEEHTTTAAASSAPAASRLNETRGPCHPPNGMTAAGAAAGKLLATAEAMAGGG